MTIKNYRRRLILLALALLAAALLARAAWYLGYLEFGRRLNLANHARIQHGMSLPEVEAVLGGPPGYYERRFLLGLFPYDGRNVGRESTPSTKLTGRAFERDWTDRERGTIRVQFDPAYKVTHVDFWPKF